MQQTTLIEQREKIIISIDAEKAPDKAENPFMIKIFNKLGIKGDFLNLMEEIYKKMQLTSHIRMKH